MLRFNWNNRKGSHEKNLEELSYMHQSFETYDL